MNYKRINSSIIKKDDLFLASEKTKDYYKYLLNNNVAYYYSTVVVKKRGRYEKSVIRKGEEFNNKYSRTLKLLDKIGKDRGIDFLLFKTYKYIQEVVDGDIDIIVHAQDFQLWMDLLEKAGFECRREEKFKGICTRRNYCKIEPRTSVTFHGFQVIGEEKLWKDAESVSIAGIKTLKTSLDIDVCTLLLNTLYGPNYIKLYTFIIAQQMNIKKVKNLLGEKIYEDLLIVSREIDDIKILDNKFPIFLKNRVFLIWWFKRYLTNTQVSLIYKIKHLIFFYYLKYRFILGNNLYFAHDWDVL